MAPIRLARLSAVYLRVANLTFGGGDPTMAALQAELVHRRTWLSREQYGTIYALARVTPGTNMLAFCAGTAWVLAGWPGALLAVAAATLPSAAMTAALSAGYENWTANPRALAAIAGTLASAAGMMAAGCWQLIEPHLSRGKWPWATALALVALALAMAGLSPIQVLALAALAGFLRPV